MERLTHTSLRTLWKRQAEQSYPNSNRENKMKQKLSKLWIFCNRKEKKEKEKLPPLQKQQQLAGSSFSIFFFFWILSIFRIPLVIRLCFQFCEETKRNPNAKERTCVSENTFESDRRKSGPVCSDWGSRDPQALSRYLECIPSHLPNEPIAEEAKTEEKQLLISLRW